MPMAGCVFGATVELEDMDSGDDVTYQIVGDDEADIKAGKISLNSPIARALIGKFAGDVAEVQTPGGGASTKFSTSNTSEMSRAGVRALQHRGCRLGRRPAGDRLPRRTGAVLATRGSQPWPAMLAGGMFSGSRGSASLAAPI